MGRQIQLGQSIKILWERWLTQNVEEHLQFLKEEMEKGNKAQSGGLSLIYCTGQGARKTVGLSSQDCELVTSRRQGWNGRKCPIGRHGVQPQVPRCSLISVQL